jgi:glyoxylase-like metal-dependent hydrolase (beta-lactamase superfamily II)
MRPCGMLSICILSSLVLMACGQRIPPELDRPPETYTVTTGGPQRSMIHLARVETGIVVVDLGWWGAEGALEEGLETMGANRDDVVAVFLTHAHRDHVRGWPTLRNAPFHMAEAEVELFHGEVHPGGWIPRWAERIVRTDLPERGEVEVRAFAGDTAFTFGPDTVRAFHVPGHTPGSAAYLLNGTLFAGDAISSPPTADVQPALAGFSDDTSKARQSLHLLRARLEPHPLRLVCTAHAHCSEAGPEFWARVLAP